MSRFDRMRAEMAAGQFLDVSGAARPGRVAALKTGSYTAEGPVLIGAALARAGPGREGPLRLVRAGWWARRSSSGTTCSTATRRRRRRRGRRPACRERPSARSATRRSSREGAEALIEIAELLRSPGAPDAGVERGRRRRRAGCSRACPRRPSRPPNAGRVAPRRAAVVRLARGRDLRLDPARRAGRGRTSPATPGSRSRSTSGERGSRSPASRSAAPAEPLLAESAAMRKPISAWHEKYRPAARGGGVRAVRRGGPGARASSAW